MRTDSRPFGTLLLALAIVMPARGGAQDDHKNVPQVVSPFTSKDIDGHSHSQAEFSGRGGLILFFCGCDPCHRVARMWGQIQRGGALPNDATGKPATTLIFYFGEAGSGRSFIQETGLDPAQTSLVTDPMMNVARKFGVEACPRAFVADAGGGLTYTNVKKDDGPEHVQEAVLISRIVQAFRDDVKPTTAGPKPADAMTSELVAVPQKGDEVVSPVSIIRHLGDYSREKTPPMEQFLLLVNRGKEPVTIGKVEGSCGCTDVLLYSGDRRPAAGNAPHFAQGEEKRSMTLAPGAKATLRVTLNVAEVEVSPGRHRKYAWVMLRGSEAAVTLALDFAVHSSVSSKGKRLEFGLVRAGEGRTVPFTIDVDDKSPEASKPPVLASTNPSVKVRQAGGALTTFVDGKPVAQIAYEISLSPQAPLGNVDGSLVIRPTNPKSKPRVLATFGGEVAGEVRALPGTLLFGTVEKGTEHRQKATLLLEKAEVRSGLKVATSAPWLSAKLVDPPRMDGNLGPYTELEVTLTPQAPVGAVQRSVTVVTASGQKLVVPVVASVKK